MPFLISPVKITHHPDPVRILVKDRKTDRVTKKSLIEYLAETCPLLIGEKARYIPTPWLFNGHLQTVHASYFNKTETGYDVKYER